jgi:hypothetical protein
MPEAELIGLNRLNVGGKVFEKGVKTPIDMPTALALAGNPRFKVTGLDTREALEFREMARRPTGQALYAAINDANDRLDVDDDQSFDGSGKPAVAALSHILGYPITKEERDAALKAVPKAPQAPSETNTDEIKDAAAAKSGGVRIKKTTPATAPAETELDPNEPKVHV